ncbi:MAG: XTP/dITP diphosphatase [Theionarchaea archaeon]|nr:XTP/dITP diphosphatase [Theionarchaea archaeon]MBU7000580.1 XTP/dITP diphosphatase [Theionarchaea archaeon]MBU7020482.1 XTP/dITP diphosphatase [Theionarchaea archaeon]MBU7034476.1 XTP/dITP diphosphatase [Theionarchaea archaeon]MBU7039775.1 XTP/dITP diphosphatase [Theionarchaea archaeon]
MLYFITSNNHKCAEIRKLTDIPIVQRDLSYPEIQADTLQEVAESGAEYCYPRLGEPCFVEDSGLFCDALRGFPGPYSNYVYRTLGCEGILRLVSQNRNAHFASVIAYHDGSEVNLFMGEIRGTLAETIKGEKGFGFDPIFIPEGETRTFAEMETEEKNLYSHRGKAFTAFISYLNQVR